MTRAFHIIATLAALADAIAILDLKGVLPLLPEGWALYVAGIPNAAALIVHFLKSLQKNLEEANPTNRP